MKIVFFQNNAGEAVVLNGLAFGEPDIELIDKKERIWEIKTRFGGNIYRIFFTINEDAILLHGFQKKLKKLRPMKLIRQLKD